jgi:hypothetical protein
MSIRSAVNTKFVEMLPQLAVIGGKKFRRTILDWSVETLEITMAAAATHYNHAFHRIKECEPELVQGLGRPEGKNNGGRKRKGAAAPAAAPVAPLLLTYTPAAAPALDLSVLLQAPLLPLLPEVAVEPQLFTVVRCKDGAEVGTGLTKEAAEEMIAKAAAGKKAKLQIKE